MILEKLFSLMVTGAVALIVIFTITWLIQLKTKNAAIVDSVWAVSFPLLAGIYFFKSEFFLARNVILFVMVFAWGMRLATHLFVRTINHAEDVRYIALREQWGSKQNILMLRFFYFQAILAVLLSYPFAVVMINPSIEMNYFEWTGVVLWIMSVIGESIADAQLKKFKSDTSNKGKICETGLWNYSRHPNYFFEWLVWVSFFVFALGSPWGWLSIICVVLMLFFLLKVTGIPYTEQQMIKSRGQAFIEYQKTTSAFIPLPKRISGFKSQI